MVRVLRKSFVFCFLHIISIFLMVYGSVHDGTFIFRFKKRYLDRGWLKS